MAWKWTEARLAILALLMALALRAHAQDTIILRGDTIRVGELEWDMEKDWRSRRDLVSDNKPLYGEHVRILLKYHRNRAVAQIVFGYMADDSGFVPHGPARYFLDSGHLLSKRRHVNGILQGPATDYHKNGQLRVQSQYDQGMLHGSYRTYYENGQLEMLAQYDHEQPTGRHQAWYSNGARKWVELYDNGTRSGPDTSFYETGAIEAVSQYQNGKPHGTWRYYHRNGLPWTERNYEEGRLEDVMWIRSNEGKPLETGTFVDGNGWLYIYNDDGLPVERERYRAGVLVKVKPYNLKSQK